MAAKILNGDGRTPPNPEWQCHTNFCPPGINGHNSCCVTEHGPCGVVPFGGGECIPCGWR